MNLKEFHRILEVTLLLPMVLLLLLGLVLTWQIERTLKDRDLIDHSDQVTVQLTEVQRLVGDEASSLRGYQLSLDPLTLAPLHAASGPLQVAFNRLTALVKSDPDQELRLRQLRDGHAIWLGFASQVQAESRAGDLSKDPALGRNERQAMDSLRIRAHDMMLVEAARRQRQTRATSVRVRTLMTVVLFASVGLGFFLGIFTQRNLKKVSLAFSASLAEARRQSAELFESRQWLRTTLESMGDALIACDRHGKVEFMNPIAQELTGWSLSEAQGRPLTAILRIVDPDSRAPIENLSGLGSGKSQVASQTQPAILIRRDGHELEIDNSAAPIRGAAGEATGAVLVFRDITEKRKAEAALLANEKLAVAGRLAASIAHEIHNPLDAVANLHYLMEHEVDPARQRRHLAMAQQELGRTLQISRAMLGLYREPKAPVDVNLGELLESVLVLLDRRLKEQSIAVERRLDPAATVEGFPGELRQVFTNLIANAAEAAGPGGRVSVQLETVDHSDGRSGSAVTITDNGPGLPEGMEARLFQPFFTTKGEHGTGLGLWVSRGIVEKHGGTLELANSTEREFSGARVRVYLPAHAASADQQEVGHPVSRS